jgi:hypothetical protein
VNRKLVVWLTVAADKEEAFNRWYEDDYIPRFVTQIPGIERVTRWKIDGSTTYLTIYDLSDGADFDDVADALSSSARDTDREAWKEWEQSHLEDFRDGFFSQVYEYKSEAVTSA